MHECTARYLARYGPLIDTDGARELCDEYMRSPSGRTLLSRVTYQPAKKVARALFEHLMGSSRYWSMDTVVTFMSGGSGTGKTTVRTTLCEKNKKLTTLLIPKIPPDEGEPLSIVVDGTLSSYEQAAEQIECCLAQSARVIMIHVTTDFAVAFKRTVHRAIRMGRVVCIDNLAINHIASRATFLKLHDQYGAKTKYKGQIEWACLDTTNEKAREVPIAKLKMRESMQFDSLKVQALTILENEFQDLRTTNPILYKEIIRPGTRSLAAGQGRYKSKAGNRAPASG